MPVTSFVVTGTAWPPFGRALLAMPVTSFVVTGTAWPPSGRALLAMPVTSFVVTGTAWPPFGRALLAMPVTSFVVTGTAWPPSGRTLLAMPEDSVSLSFPSLTQACGTYPPRVPRLHPHPLAKRAGERAGSLRGGRTALAPAEGSSLPSSPFCPKRPKPRRGRGFVITSIHQENKGVIRPVMTEAVPPVFPFSAVPADRRRAGPGAAAGPSGAGRPRCRSRP